VQGVTVGFVYEPLVYINTLKNAAETPMLATKYSWGAGKKSLTFTIRDGVKWNDGKPFTAKDVAFTFNELKKYPGLDLNALWKSILTKVTATNDKTVAFEFKGAAQPYFYYIADQVSIVPEHIWTTGQAAKDPVQFNDPAPVGTGPYTVNPCKPANITYKANPTYWQSGLPKVKTVNYPAYTDNSPANLDLATGKAQWGGQFIPSVDKYYVAKDKANHHYWYPPVSNVDLVFNLKHPVTGKLAIRQAFAYAIDRAAVGKIGEGGYQPAGQPDRDRPSDLPVLVQQGRGGQGELRRQRRQGNPAAGLRGLLQGQAVEPRRHHGQWVHRLGRLASGDQAGTPAARHQADDQGPGRADV